MYWDTRACVAAAAVFVSSLLVCVSLWKFRFRNDSVHMNNFKLGMGQYSMSTLLFTQYNVRASSWQIKFFFGTNTLAQASVHRSMCIDVCPKSVHPISVCAWVYRKLFEIKEYHSGGDGGDDGGGEWWNGPRLLNLTTHAYFLVNPVEFCFAFFSLTLMCIAANH